MELKHESITLSSLVRRALNPTCSILICFSREGGGVLAPGLRRSLYRRVQGILRSLLESEKTLGTRLCTSASSQCGQQCNPSCNSTPRGRTRGPPRVCILCLKSMCIFLKPNFRSPKGDFQKKLTLEHHLKYFSQLLRASDRGIMWHASLFLFLILWDYCIRRL